MWAVYFSVGNPVRRNVDRSYPPKSQISAKVIKRFYPQPLFSVYSSLEHLLGFPRPYYYY